MRERLVIHGMVDGFSSYIPYLVVAARNDKDFVLNVFVNVRCRVIPVPIASLTSCFLVDLAIPSGAPISNPQRLRR
jgi:hypothetical protein